MGTSTTKTAERATPGWSGLLRVVGLDPGAELAALPVKRRLPARRGPRGWRPAQVSFGLLEASALSGEEAFREGTTLLEAHREPLLRLCRRGAELVWSMLLDGTEAPVSWSLPGGAWRLFEALPVALSLHGLLPASASRSDDFRYSAELQTDAGTSPIVVVTSRKDASHISARTCALLSGPLGLESEAAEPAQAHLRVHVSASTGQMGFDWNADVLRALSRLSRVTFVFGNHDSGGACDDEKPRS